MEISLNLIDDGNQYQAIFAPYLIVPDQKTIDAATQAAISASSAIAAATSASTSANGAATSATNSATSEANALSSKNSAATSATNASTSASSANTSASNASASATSASASASSANTSATTAASILNNSVRTDVVQSFTAPQTAQARSNIGLSNVDNTSDVNKPVSTAQQTAITNAINSLVNAAPGTLDTLAELATALGNDPNFATTIATSLGNRLRVDTAAQGLSGTQKTNAKTNISIENIDNTSDVNKPVSTAQSTAIALKADLNGNGTQNFNVLSINGGPIAGVHNRIINGDMAVDQRNAGATLTLNANAGGAYTADRWAMFNNRTNGTTLVAQRIAITPTTISCSPFALKLTNTSAGASASTDNIQIGQPIEGLNLPDLLWGTSAAKTITVAFSATASIAGNYAVALRNGATNRSYVTHVNIASPNTEQLVSATIPGDTSGTWATDQTIGITLSVDLGVGSTFNTSTLNTWQSGNFFGSTTAVKMNTVAGSTFQITGVRVFQGSVVSPMEQLPYSVKLAMCQRYYHSNVGTMGGYTSSGTANAYNIPFPVAMRVSPTVISTPITNNNTTGAAMTVVDNQMSQHSSSGVATGGFVSAASGKYSAEL